MKISIPIIYGAAVASAIAIQVNLIDPRDNNNAQAQKPELEASPLAISENEIVLSNISETEKPQQPKKQSDTRADADNVPQAALSQSDQLIHDPTQKAPAALVDEQQPQETVTKDNPQANDQIPADDRVIYGELENGMRYILMQNKLPAKRVSMRLHVGAGSLNEAEDQRGVAHFLEHMVFNGTKNFPDSKKLIPKMQRLGIAFGAHANAYTSFDETVYMLDLPNSEQDTLKLAFDVMQDFAGGALLEEHEIDEERGVISSEKTSRDSVQRRMMEKQFKKLFPKSLVANRFPIGTEEIIQNAKRDRFTDFYDRFYRPKNMCFVYVGDFDPDHAKQVIAQTFGKLSEPENPGPPPAVGDLTTPPGFQTSVFSDKELSSTELSLTTSNAYQIKQDTLTNRTAKIPLSIANSILSKRFSNLILDDPTLPILSGSASRIVLFKEIEMGSFSVSAKEGKWKKALPILVREYKRALDHGFTIAEIDEAKANILNAYENRVKSAATRKSPELASSLVANYHNKTIFSTPEKDFEIVDNALNQLSPEMCHTALKEFWKVSDLHLILTGPTATSGDNAVLTSLFRSEAAKETQAPEVKVIEKFAYSDTSQKGKIKKSTDVEDLDFTQLILANNIRVNYKKTDFVANSISITAHFGGGKLSQPEQKPGIDQLASSVINMGGLGKHSAKDLQSILAGKSVGVSFSIGTDAFTLSGSTTQEDLQLQLQLLTAAIKDPGFRPEGEQLFKSQLPQLYKSMQFSTQGGSNEMNKILAGNDERFGLPEQKMFDQLSTDDVKAWILPQLKEDYLEVTIVGDFEPKQLEALLLNTVATLPKRASKATDYSATADLSIMPFPIKKTFPFESKVPNAIAINAWRTNRIETSISEARRLNVLATILGERMRVKLREELGQAYSPGAFSAPDSTFKNKSYILAQCPGKAKDVEELAAIVEQIADDLATKGASQDEVSRALEPTLASLDKTLRENRYWMHSVLSESQKKPNKLEWARNRNKDYHSITPEEINALAKKYLIKKNAAQFIIIPEE